MDVLSTRLGALTRPVSPSAPTAAAVTTIIDPIAGSMTRIPVAALRPAQARFTSIPDSPQPVDLVPAKPNAPVVPAAFARRARPAPLPPGTVSDSFLTVKALAHGTPQTSETAVAAASVVSPPDDAPAIIPDGLTVAAATLAPAEPPAPPLEKPSRYDPFDFMRTATIKNHNAEAS
jgi:hypothetical protein